MTFGCQKIPQFKARPLHDLPRDFRARQGAKNSEDGMDYSWSKKELLPEIEAVRKSADMDYWSPVQDATSDGERIANEVEEQEADCRIV